MGRMNTKGQNLLSFTAGVVVFVLIWGIWLGKFLAEWCSQAIIDNSYTGIVAFGLAYINLWIFLMLLLVCAFAYYGGTS